MTFREFAAQHSLELEVRERTTYPAGHPYRFFVTFKDVHRKDDIFLESTFANGSTPEEAEESYSEKLRGQILVYWTDKEKRQIQAPRTWETEKGRRMKELLLRDDTTLKCGVSKCLNPPEAVGGIVTAFCRKHRPRPLSVVKAETDTWKIGL